MSDIPKEQQTAYQRWEMTSFGDERPSVVATRTPAQGPVGFVPPPPPPLDYPTEGELAAIREEARSSGYQDGLAAGQQEGHDNGYAAAHAEVTAKGKAELAISLKHINDIAQQFGEALSGADELIAHDVLELALQLAKGMLKTALPVRPELILPIVRDAIEYLPSLQQPALLMLNPDDAKVVREGIGEELDKGGWRVIEDHTVERGGCKIDTASNQIDAQTSSRWQRLTQALGKDIDWLGPA